MEERSDSGPRLEAAAIVLAGGKSSRMGRPKAMLPFDGEPLIVHIVRSLRRIFAEVVVVAAPAQELPPLPAALARDEVPHQGPVGGIYYGLLAAGANRCFVTSCDVAFINRPLISFLLSRASDYDVVVPYWDERLQPLHAVYGKPVLPLLKEQLDRGRLRPVFLYDRVRTDKVGEEEIRRFDPEGLSFLNMNTPADYEAVLKRWREGREPGPPDGTACKSLHEGVSAMLVTVELLGVARLLAKAKAVPLSLSGEATLAEVLSRLAEALPVLVGRVISADRETLSGGYACNINGLRFVRDPRTKVGPGDKIFILSADAGG